MSLIGISNKTAIEMIESSNQNDLVTINYVRCPDFNEQEGSAFKPTWRYFISIPM
jgi:hypothetical protein